MGTDNKIANVDDMYGGVVAHIIYLVKDTICDFLILHIL